MALDLSRFAKAFFEEAREHLSALESLLISTNLASPEAESLNAIFRAVHSVKGGAAAFGHKALAEFTHDFETILDRIRKGTLPLTRSMVNTFLKAGDLMQQHLDALEAEQETDVAPMQAMRAALLQFVSAHDQPEPILEEEAVTEILLPPRFSIRIGLDRESYEDAEALESLKHDIAGLGQARQFSTSIKDLNTIEFAFGLDTDIDADELRESLEFIVPAESIHIVANERRTGRSASDTPVAPPIDDDDGSFGFFEPVTNQSPQATQHASTAGANDSDTPDVQLASLGDASSIRVSVAKVDQLINLVGELVISEAMVAQGASLLPPDQVARLSQGLAQFERNTRDLQDAVLAIRMMPISFVFSRLPRLTRDLAERLGKEVELELFGEETELDKSVIEKIADPLTHLVRNALDHGIETPLERTAKGKPAMGHLTVRAAHQGGSIVLSVADDGAGLDRARIVAKAHEVGLDVGEHWTDAEVWQLIFTPGFSTASSVTDVSGRGVGMDVVWRNVNALGGRIELHSVSGQGTTMTIRLPLTLAILDGMSIAVSGETYILPLANIVQSLQPERSEVKSLGGAEVVWVHDEYVPITSLAEVFNLPQHAPDAPNAQPRCILVVLEMNGMRAALRVDDLLGQHQVVLKSLEANYRKVDAISGATILGDGRVALILDASYLVGLAHSNNSAVAARGGMHVH